MAKKTRKSYVKYGDEIKEQAYQLYAANQNYSATAKELGVSYATVYGWIKEKPPDELDVLREEKVRGFIDHASEIIDKGLRLLDRRLTTALDYETELEAIIAEIYSTGREEMSQDEKTRLVSKIRALQTQKISEITTAIGTLYDKRALAQGDSTENTTITVSLPEGLSEFAE